MIRDDLRSAIHEALAAAELPGPSEITLEPPKHRDHGDWSTNVAMVLRPTVGGNPLDIARRIADALSNADVPHLAKVEVAPPGFVNLFLAPTWLYDVLREVVAADDAWGTSDVLAGARINLEFVSVNPTGPLHAGGGRWIAVGDAIANLLAAQGADVHREYYLNDAGTQLDLFGASLYARDRRTDLPEHGHQGDYLFEMADRMPPGA